VEARGAPSSSRRVSRGRDSHGGRATRDISRDPSAPCQVCGSAGEEQCSVVERDAAYFDGSDADADDAAERVRLDAPAHYAELCRLSVFRAFPLAHKAAISRYAASAGWDGRGEG
jgi:hypothetical protein